MVMPKGKRLMPKAEMVAREKAILELRQRGKKFDEIAEELGLTYTQVYGSYRKALGRINIEQVDAVRKLETARLDALLNAVWDTAMLGDTESVNTAIRISERRAKLLGLNHADAVNEQRLKLEQAMAITIMQAINATLGELGLDTEVQNRARELLATRLEAITKAPTEPTENVIEGEIVQDGDGQ